MKKTTLLSLLIISAVILLAGCGNDGATARADQAKQPAKQKVAQTSDLPVSSMETVADKVQVFLFHTTQRCSTCIAIGKLAGETVNERFQNEIRSGKIEFREVNIDLPENKALAERFQANGSALYLNAIKGEADNIEQDVKVWRLTGNPAAFKDYLEGRINILLGK